MSPDEPRELLHQALGSHEGVPLRQAELTGQQRLAIVLQGAALLAHLEHGGWFLPGGWRAARVAEGAILAVPALQRGRLTDLPQVLLLRLLSHTFRVEAGDGIPGRGEARRAARRLLELWQQNLIPLALDQAVAEIVDCAPFLWQPAFAAARAALVAEHRCGETSHLWIAGPGWSRRRILALSTERSEVEALLRGPEARDLWEGWLPGADPVALAWKRRYRQAAACWRRQPPGNSAEAILHARCFFAQGLFSRAHEALRGRKSFEARLLRLRCLGELGRLEAVRRMLHRFRTTELSASQTLELAEAAVRILALQGQHEAARDWVARAFRATRKSGRPLRWRAELLAAEVAWDHKDLDTMARHLDSARGMLEDPETARRWHEVASLLALGARDGAAVVEHSAAVLRERRRMSPAAAGRRWNDLAYGRVLLGDLAGAERAIRHAQRLLSATDSSSRATLGLSNLAEIRLRRGRLDGVVEALEASTDANRRNGNTRGLIGDLEVRVRLDLVQGRPGAALAHCREACALIAEHGVGDRQVFDLFAARAHGWSERPERAAACLARVSPEIFHELEPEERPAVWALAGRADRAADEATGTPWAELWSAHVASLHPRPGAWDELRRLESFRAARLVFDYEMIHPRTVPPAWIRKAIASLRSVEAEDFADRLERRCFSPWQAVKRYLELNVIDGSQLADLFRSAGYCDVRLALTRDGDEQVLIPGPGGEGVLERPCQGGRLTLEAPFIDTALEALFILIQRDVKPPKIASRVAPRAGSVIGESPALKEALERIDQLASRDLPVLVLGESGTGKELAARRIHSLSLRGTGAFEAVNCAALPEDNLAQSELFGHVRGAFTGADRDRPGIFEQARGGTVFLDEIGDLPLALQGKLLRVLQEGEIRRLGESFARKVDVRVVAATHRDVQQMVRDGKFREDLFFRLTVATVKLPPLRKRGGDVLLLADHFLSRYADKHALPQGELLRMSPAAKERLLRHTWPGNVRELQNAMETAVTLAQGREIQPQDLDLPEAAAKVGFYHQQVDELRRRLISEALAESDGNRAAAARRLGLTRQALSYLARQFGLP